MAKSAKSKKSSNNKLENLIKLLKDERTRFILGVLFVGMALLFTLAFTSYLFSWEADQSFEWEKAISSSQIKANNWIGKLGAEISVKFMSNWFGIASYIFPFLFLVIGLRLFNVKFLPVRRTLQKSLIGLILLSVSLAYLFGATNGYIGSGLGGAHGFTINMWLESFLGKVGVGILLLVAISVYITIFFESIYFSIKKKVLNLIHGVEDDTDVKMSTSKVPVKDEKQEDDGFDVLSGDLREELNAQAETEKQEIETELQLEEKIELGVKKEEKPEDDLGFETIDSRKAEQEEIVDDESGFGMAVHRVEEEVRNDSFMNNTEEYDPTLDLSNFKFPALEILADHSSGNSEVSNEELLENKNRIVETLGNYSIKIDKIKATIGPTVTLYEIVPAPGVRISKIKNLEDDIALSLAALGIRIIAPIPGKGTIGIEVPNQKPEIVSMRSVIASSKFRDSKYELPVALGKTISNETYVTDLAKMPHLLMAGATGQGKSVGLNAILASLLYKKHPSQLKFVLVDPKKVELTLYSRIEKHYLAKLPDEEEPIITDTNKVVTTLNSLCVEMDTRYDLLKNAQVRNIKEYNAKFVARKLNPNNGHKFLPYIVVVVDEFADLIMTAGREVETPIGRLAQLARAIGIHLIIATQRPSTNIITGVIKANFPARIAFRVSSMVDSRTILDSPGANQLIGRGDMLISLGSDLLRLQCAFVDTPEIEELMDHISAQQSYPSALILPEVADDGGAEAKDVDLKKRDSLFEEAARCVTINQQGSTSLIQRKFSIGYNRAGRIIDQLEAAGIVGPFEGSKARQVLVQDETSLEHLLTAIDMK